MKSCGRKHHVKKHEWGNLGTQDTSLVLPVFYWNQLAPGANVGSLFKYKWIYLL